MALIDIIGKIVAFIISAGISGGLGYFTYTMVSDSVDTFAYDRVQEAILETKYNNMYMKYSCELGQKNISCDDLAISEEIRPVGVCCTEFDQLLVDRCLLCNYYYNNLTTYEFVIGCEFEGVEYSLRTEMLGCNGTIENVVDCGNGYNRSFRPEIINCYGGTNAMEAECMYGERGYDSFWIFMGVMILIFGGSGLCFSVLTLGMVCVGVVDFFKWILRRQFPAAISLQEFKQVGV
ncbi:MAG: hypothetical protein Hyperionvirus1_15 [Hyperionvirus sp.]|uniref:Uncharacterized protein n=1 Tax=Hyperionvirus sp. TaxID=2487770 RepID=A0A3G5A5B9_9VIRU|nr:MAG: hypothetical protein Hyperionvirus1_15 [Hyperionvirus sp.]